MIVATPLHGLLVLALSSTIVTSAYDRRSLVSWVACACTPTHNHRTAHDRGPNHDRDPFSQFWSTLGHIHLPIVA